MCYSCDTSRGYTQMVQEVCKTVIFWHSQFQTCDSAYYRYIISGITGLKLRVPENHSFTTSCMCECLRYHIKRYTLITLYTSRGKLPTSLLALYSWAVTVQWKMVQDIWYVPTAFRIHYRSRKYSHYSHTTNLLPLLHYIITIYCDQWSYYIPIQLLKSFKQELKDCATLL